MKKLFQYSLLMLVSMPLVAMDEQTIIITKVTNKFGERFSATFESTTRLRIGENRYTNSIPLFLEKICYEKTATKNQVRKKTSEKIDKIQVAFEKMKKDVELDIFSEKGVNQFAEKLEKEAQRRQEKIGQLKEELKRKTETDQEKMRVTWFIDEFEIFYLKKDIKREVKKVYELDRQEKEYLEKIRKTHRYLQKFLSQATRVMFSYKIDPSGFRRFCQPKDCRWHMLAIIKDLGTYAGLKIEEFFESHYHTVYKKFERCEPSIIIYDKEGKVVFYKNIDAIESVVGSLEPAAIARAYNEGRLTR